MNNEEKVMVTRIRITDVTVECPHCSANVDGFIGDPRGKEFHCDECDQPFTIINEPDYYF